MAFELLVVALGVWLGIAAANWNEAREDRQRGRLILDALRSDLNDSIYVEKQAIALIDKGLGDFEAARKRGERPIPFSLVIPGAWHAPDTIWDATRQSGLADLMPPDLLFDLGFFYSERSGVGDRYAHYATFVEDEIYPRIKAGAGAFYDADGKLKPEFAANLDRLRDFRNYTAVSMATEQCLLKRFDDLSVKGPRCRNDYGPLYTPDSKS